MIRSASNPGAWSRARALAAVVGLTVACLGCEDEPIGPEGQPFGRIGEVRIEVLSPLSGGAGRIEHIVVWSSRGPWQSTERISYGGRLGDETKRLSTASVTSLARSYAAWVDLVNDTPGLSLFGDRLDPDLDPVCDPPSSRVSVRIADETRRDSISWSRCALNGLPALSGEGAGPDPDASRVIQAAALVRDFTLIQHRGFSFQYTGSVPFATLDRGGASAIPLSSPRVIEDLENLTTFWTALTGDPDASPPAVDFDVDVVLVGVVGTRREAGDSVEIRGVLPVGNGTQIALWERRAGHFCTPARLTHVPYHVVIAPGEPLTRPIFFSDVSLDTIPCG